MARLGFAIGAGIVALAVFTITLWFLGDALMLLLEAHALTPAAAASLTGVAGLVLVGILALAARLMLRPSRPRNPAPPVTSGAGLAADLGALAAREIVSAARAHPYSTSGAALAAGLALGALPELRKALTSLLKH